MMKWGIPQMELRLEMGKKLSKLTEVIVLRKVKKIDIYFELFVLLSVYKRILNVAESEIRPSPNLPYVDESIAYTHQKGFKRYYPTFSTLLPSKATER